MVQDASPPPLMVVHNKVPMQETAARLMVPVRSEEKPSGSQHRALRRYSTIEWSLNQNRRWIWARRQHREILLRPPRPRRHPKKPFGFSHTPPRRLLPEQRWRGDSDPQWFPSTATLADVEDILLTSGVFSPLPRQVIRRLATKPSACRPSLQDIAVHMLENAYLTTIEQGALRCISRQFRYGSVGLPLWVSRPWQPFRRRQYGFGACHKDRSCHHDKVSPYSMLHFTWKLYSAGKRHHAVQQFQV